VMYAIAFFFSKRMLEKVIRSNSFPRIYPDQH
jgi:hypothetical protein